MGPVATNVRPCSPSDSHVTSDPGPPERRSEVVGSTPGSVPSSMVEYAALMASSSRAPTTVTASVHTTRATITTVDATASHAGTTRVTPRCTRRTPMPTRRPITMNSTVTTAVTTTIGTIVAAPTGSRPTRARWSFCQTCQSTTPTTPTTAHATASTSPPRPPSGVGTLRPVLVAITATTTCTSDPTIRPSPMATALIRPWVTEVRGMSVG